MTSQVSVTCSTNPAFSIGGTVTGLRGSGLLLQDNRGDDLTVAADATTFTFATPVQQGAPYAVTVAALPRHPAQTCTLQGARGTVGQGNVESVAITCSDRLFSLGGTVSGLSGSGVLLRLGAEDLGLPADGGFTFATGLPGRAPYSVSVARQPVSPSQTCALVGGGDGVMPDGDVTSLAVACVTDPFYAISGAISGLSGSGLVLQDAGGDDLAVGASATSFTFAAGVQGGLQYAVTVKRQPAGPTQSCRVVSGSGTVGAGAVGTVQILCAVSAFAVGGTVTGLLTGASVTLVDDGFDQRTVAGNASGTVAFTFGTAIASQRTYSAAVLSSTGPVSCSITSGAAGTVTTAAINPIAVACIPAFTIAGTVAGDNGTGLQLANAATGEVLTVAKGATSFAFTRPVKTAQGYSVAVVTQPTGLSQTCAVSASSPSPASGNPSNNVTDLAIACVTNAFAIGGSVLGLPAGASLSLLDNGGDALAVPGAGDGSAPTPFVFATPLPSGAAYAVTIASQGGPVSCSLTSGASGTVAAANVGAVLITCVPTFTIAGALSGYTGAGLVLRNTITGGAVLESLTVSASSTTFAFTKPVTRAQGYAISVATQPAAPAQVCSPSGATATPPSGSPAANVTDLAFACATTSFTVGGAVTGLPAGASVTLLNNGVDSKVVAGAGTGAAPVAFTFTTKVASGGRYSAVITDLSPGALGSLWVGGSWSGTLTYKGRTPALGTTAAVGEPLLLHFPQGPP